MVGFPGQGLRRGPRRLARVVQGFNTHVSVVDTSFLLGAGDSFVALSAVTDCQAVVKVRSNSSLVVTLLQAGLQPAFWKTLCAGARSTSCQVMACGHRQRPAACRCDISRGRRQAPIPRMRRFTSPVLAAVRTVPPYIVRNGSL